MAPHPLLRAWQRQFQFLAVYDKGPAVPCTDTRRQAQIVTVANGDRLSCSGGALAGFNPQRASALHPCLLCSPVGRSWVTFTSVATSWLLQVV